jgi:hypothetical protein
MSLDEDASSSDLEAHRVRRQARHRRYALVTHLGIE